MRRRERLEKKIENRNEWAEKAEDRSSDHYSAAKAILDVIPPGQPILVGHHSEKRHRRDLGKVDSHMEHMREEDQLAKHHHQKADGLAIQLERTIFSDDLDAIEKLEDRISALENQSRGMKYLNKIWRAAKLSGKEATITWLSRLDPQPFNTPALNRKLAQIAQHWQENPAPFSAFEMSNLRGRITAANERIKQINRREAHEDRAREAGGLLIETKEHYTLITFADKPERHIINALKDSGFWWTNGQWAGHDKAVPEVVKDLLPERLFATTKTEEAPTTPDNTWHEWPESS